MKSNILLTGVGGEGVLTSQVIIARAANFEGYFVRGIQLHGLAQRGGLIPTMVRFGTKDEIFSPSIMQANADLILAFEPLEAVRATYYARKERTIFMIDDSPYVPVYSRLLTIPYPDISEIKNRVVSFAKKVHIFSTHQIAEKELGNSIFGNTILIGAAVGVGGLPLKEESLIKSIEVTAPRELEKNLKAFKLGLNIAKP
jgi:indolepyruvate ferredoxin oxidoreductase beta subunit